jgi:hypothetical protein
MKQKHTKGGSGGKGSSKVNYAVGSGSRPTGGRIPIPTSAPKQEHGLSRRGKITKKSK